MDWEVCEHNKIGFVTIEFIYRYQKNGSHPQKKHLSKTRQVFFLLGYQPRFYTKAEGNISVTNLYYH
jgi:hypothetical protein